MGSIIGIQVGGHRKAPDVGDRRGVTCRVQEGGERGRGEGERVGGGRGGRGERRGRWGQEGERRKGEGEGSGRGEDTTEESI